MAYIGGGIVAVLVAATAFFASYPAQDYAISVDPLLSKGPGGTYTHVTIKNTGKQPLTNVKIDYGGTTKPEFIPVLIPGEKIMLSPPDGSDLGQVRVTADDGIDIAQPYRSPLNAPLIGNGGFGQ